MRKGAAPACLDEARRDVARIEREAREALEAAGDPEAATKCLLDDPWSEVKGDCKEALRKALIRDQSGLCAYCGARLKLNTMKVEHFLPRSGFREHILDWGNLLGCCPGEYSEGQQTTLHCDSHRTDYSAGPPPKGLLHVHPVQSPQEPERLFPVKLSARGSGLGVITPTSEEAAHDLGELNLNAPRLVQNRAEAIRRLRERLRPLSPTQVRRLLLRSYATATTPGPKGLPPYAHVLAAYISRKLDQHGLSA
ncbi:MAG: TIGR02646 family protein [Alphaproteobacteria bacterium]|nr:TIGR02646 family protein [Alphaproteobacteria bacterium]